MTAVVDLDAVTGVFFFIGSDGALAFGV